ncbi:hypothetical protein KC330_g166 [Hortaea werneckii]|nr:hypothetical protein KC330_g166 [Hortaea werneckii]
MAELASRRIMLVRAKANPGAPQKLPSFRPSVWGCLRECSRADSLIQYIRLCIRHHGRQHPNPVKLTVRLVQALQSIHMTSPPKTARLVHTQDIWRKSNRIFLLGPYPSGVGTFPGSIVVILLSSSSGPSNCLQSYHLASSGHRRFMGNGEVSEALNFWSLHLSSNTAHSDRLAQLRRRLEGAMRSSPRFNKSRRTYNPRRADDVPMSARVLLAPLKERIFLRVIEVGVKGYPRIALDMRRPGWTQMNAVIFRAGLQQETLWCDIGGV